MTEPGGGDREQLGAGAVTRRRLRWRVTTAVAAAVAIAAAASMAAGCAGTSRPAAPGTAGASSPPSSPGPVGESLVPASGAYLGAYVQPTAYTQPGQISAVQSFERTVGSPLQVVHVYHPWGTLFPTLADKYFVDHGKILLLTWGGDPNTKAIIAGQDDAMIRARALAIKALGHPIMLEFRHEMDRPNLQWTIHGPADYIAAWDHIRAIFSAVGATNVSWVWCPTGLGFQVGRAAAFYPGDNEVDWVCADVYSTSTSQSLSAAAAPFLHWASHHDKPVIIGEFGALGNQRGLAAWLTAAGQLPEADHQIKAMAYFDANGVDSSGHAYQHWLGGQPAALAAFAGLFRQPSFRAVITGDP
jgi:hypothetical protein